MNPEDKSQPSSSTTESAAADRSRHSFADSLSAYVERQDRFAAAEKPNIRPWSNGWTRLGIFLAFAFLFIVIAVSALPGGPSPEKEGELITQLALKAALAAWGFTWLIAGRWLTLKRTIVIAVVVYGALGLYLWSVSSAARKRQQDMQQLERNSSELTALMTRVAQLRVHPASTVDQDLASLVQIGPMIPKMRALMDENKRLWSDVDSNSPTKEYSTSEALELVDKNVHRLQEEVTAARKIMDADPRQRKSLWEQELAPLYDPEYRHRIEAGSSSIPALSRSQVEFESHRTR